PDVRPAPQPVFLSGPVAALDLRRSVLRIRGVLVSFADATFSGGTIADLRNGLEIDVEGVKSDDGAAVRATRLRFGALRTQPRQPDRPGNPGGPDRPDNPRDPGPGNRPENPGNPNPGPPNRPDNPGNP